MVFFQDATRFLDFRGIQFQQVLFPHAAQLDPFHAKFFFFNDTATTEIYTLSLHDALPIRRWSSPKMRVRAAGTDSPAQTASSPCAPDRKSTRLNSSHLVISYAVFCLKKKKKKKEAITLKKKQKKKKEK